MTTVLEWLLRTFTDKNAHVPWKTRGGQREWEMPVCCKTYRQAESLAFARLVRDLFGQLPVSEEP